ncbi:MAG TPA: DUF4129 domain-containing protein [Candidatus Acidoferrum sp.]|nr:DUF4129 domain-containing protein [Candidatus Acidoferrum sp.]
MVAGVTFLVRWGLLPVSFVVGLAALLRMAGPVAGEADDLKGFIRLPVPVTWMIYGLFGLAALVFLIGLARRVLGRRRRSGEGELLPEPTPMPAWLRTLTQILSLANFVLIAYLIWRGVIPLTELLALGRGAVSGIGASAPQVPVSAPALLTWTFGVLAVVAAVVALALALWVGFGDRLAEWWTRREEEAPLSEAAAREPLEDPRAEPDPRRAIMRCYASFERVAADWGVTRRPWHTPAEFMREAIRRLAAPRGAVPTLTSLFELARFSHRALGPVERGRALEALDEITTARKEPGVDAAT